MTTILKRHLAVGLLGILITIFFWFSRMDWVPEMRLWKALGDTSLILLYVTLALGPLVRFISSLGWALSFRRELGIWFGVYALAHTILILNGWLFWDLGKLMGYEFIPTMGREVRLESGFGMANIAGLIAVLIMLPLMITSADRAIRYLGASAWKYMHMSIYPILYLVAIHSAYFMYIHFTESFHRPPAPVNWAQIPFAIATAAVFGVLAAGYTRTVMRRRHRLLARKVVGS